MATVVAKDATWDHIEITLLIGMGRPVVCAAFKAAGACILLCASGSVLQHGTFAHNQQAMHCEGIANSHVHDTV